MTPLTTHQTVRLERGKHSSPDEGACVMELASMLAGERFSDAPESVCPVIASFLRTYNDRVDDDRRQDLYAYAAKVVGTSSTRAVEQRRAERCLLWASSVGPERGRLERGRLERVAARVLALGPFCGVGTHAARLAARRESGRAHREALALLDELIAVGRRAPEPDPVAVPGPPVVQAVPTQGARHGHH